MWAPGLSVTTIGVEVDMTHWFAESQGNEGVIDIGVHVVHKESVSFVDADSRVLLVKPGTGRI